MIMNGKGSNENDFGLVSVVMPLYNAEAYVREAITSVIRQSYQHWELIVVDDCSNDHSVDIVKQFSDARIRLIQNKENNGAAASRNAAINQARGRWIAFLDSDDYWDHDKLRSQLVFMEENELRFSFTGYDVIDSNGKKITEYEPEKDHYSYRNILRHNHIGCSTVIYDAHCLGKVYMPEDAVKREDHACWLRILKQGVDAACLHQRLTTYRVYSQSVSANKVKMIKYQWNVYRNVEGLSLINAVVCMMHWAVLGFLKYR